MERFNMFNIRPYDKEAVHLAIARAFSLKPRYSNYYGCQLGEGDDYIETDSSLVLRKKEGDFYRVYIMSVSQAEVVDILKLIPGVNVLNIPAKNDIPEWKTLMQCAGFDMISMYERYYYKKVKERKNAQTINYATQEQTEVIYALFRSHFSAYTDYLPAKDELAALVEQGNVIVNYSEGRVCGAFIYEPEGRKCYLRAWYDEGENGLKLLFDVYCIMHLKNISYAYFWVNSTNTNVKKIHELLGAVPDGLKDYTFIKNNYERENCKHIDGNPS